MQKTKKAKTHKAKPANQVHVKAAHVVRTHPRHAVLPAHAHLTYTP